MNYVTLEDIQIKGTNYIDSLLKDDAVHIKSNESTNYVLMSEDEYDDFIKIKFELETLYSEKEYKRGKFKKGSPEELFKDIGI